MANPQLEDGYTKIANELLEALSRSNLSPYESRVLWFVIRQTYGWKKKTDLISLSQIVKGTGIEKGNTSRALKSLILRQIVVRLDNKQLGFNKDYDSWLRKLSAETPPRSCEKLSAETPQKKEYKETIQKKSIRPPDKPFGNFGELVEKHRHKDVHGVQSCEAAIP